jgi:hypothetical protein
MTDRRQFYRLTIEDADPSWSEYERGRAADVHGEPAGTGHWWTDGSGRMLDGYEPGRFCGGCGWRPDPPTASLSIAGKTYTVRVPGHAPAVDPDDPSVNGLGAVRYENVFGHRPGKKGSD